MIRIVAEHAPNLFAIVGWFDQTDDLPATLELDALGTRATYYKSIVKQHFVLYRRAISGWGAAAPNPNDARPVFDPRQR